MYVQVNNLERNCIFFIIIIQNEGKIVYYKKLEIFTPHPLTH